MHTCMCMHLRTRICMVHTHSISPHCSLRKNLGLLRLTIFQLIFCQSGVEFLRVLTVFDCSFDPERTRAFVMDTLVIVFLVPPNTAADFQVRNMFFLGYIWLPLPPFSNTAAFSSVPRQSAVLGGGGGVDCNLNSSSWLSSAMLGYTNPLTPQVSCSFLLGMWGLFVLFKSGQEKLRKFRYILKFAGFKVKSPAQVRY